MRRSEGDHGDQMRQGSRPERGREGAQGNRSWQDSRDRRSGDRDRGPERSDYGKRGPANRGRGPERDRGQGGRPDREREPLPPGLERAADEPPVPTDADLSRLPRQVRAELRSLSADAAEFVSAHLVAAGDLIDDDPVLALKHAQAAKRRGARLPLVREAVAETAYAAEDFAVALTEYRALRRLTGDSAYLPVMADCERALGRPEEALRLVREAKLVEMTQRSRVELVIIEAGAREDLGQAKEGLRVLRSFLGNVPKDVPHEAHARLAYAYAAMLLRHDQPEEAREWFATADELDTARELDAADQIELLDGVDLEFDFDEDEGDEDEGDEDEEPAEESVNVHDAVRAEADVEPEPEIEPAEVTDEAEGGPEAEAPEDETALKPQDTTQDDRAADE